MQLERIIEIAGEEFRAQIAKSKKHPGLHEQFFEDHWNGVVAHVTIQCHNTGSVMTEERVRRCVTRLWTLKKLREELGSMAKSSEPRVRAQGEHFNGRDLARPRIVYAGKGLIGATRFG